MLYFLASTVTLAASSWGVYGPSNSAHCVPFSTSITCAHALSPCTPPPAGSTPMMYFFPVTGGRKYNMRPVFLLVIILRRLLQLDVQLLAIEHAIARSEEAGLGVLGVLLWKTIAELAPHLAAEGDLPGIELVLHHQLEFLVGEVDDLDLAPVILLPPPRQEVLHVAGFGRALPLFIKCPASAAGGGFQKNLTVGRHRGPQRSQCLGHIVRPAGNLRTMQVLDGQPAAGTAVRRTFHSIFAVEFGKDDLADVGARGLQRAVSPLRWQVLQEAVHDAKNFFCGLLVVRHLHAQRSRLQHGREEESRRHVGRDPYLARLQHDVSLARLAVHLALRRVEVNRTHTLVLAADPELILDRRPACALARPPVAVRRDRLVERFAHFDQLLDRDRLVAAGQYQLVPGGGEQLEIRFEFLLLLLVGLRCRGFALG